MQHTFRHTLLVSCLLAVFVLGMGSESAGARERLRHPEGIFYFESAASVFGPEAVWANPGALARMQMANVQLIGEYFDERFFDNWGAVSANEGLGFGFRHLCVPGDGDYDEFLFGLGFSLGGLHTGGSYRYYRDAPGAFNNRHFWNLGLQYVSGQFAAGAVLSNLNRGEIDGERTEMKQQYALAYRPMGNLMTLSADFFMYSGQTWRDADWVYQATVNPYQGLYLTAAYDSDKNYQVGFRVNLNQYFAGSRSSFNRDGDHSGTAGYVGFTTARQPSVLPPPKRRLNMGIAGSLAENPPQPIFGRKRTPFTKLILEIYRAAEDPSISEMSLKLSGLAMGFGQAQELRQALEHFQSRGKRITCHLRFANNITYYVGCIADSLLMSTVGQLGLIGLKAEQTFYAGTLEKLGIEVDMVRIGDHKTAPEQYTQRGPSEASREQLNRILDDLYSQFVSAIAAGRGFTSDSVRAMIDNGPYTSVEAMELGLVDTFCYEDELSDFLRPMSQVGFADYVADTLVDGSWRKRPQLAVVVAEGSIAYHDGNYWPLVDQSEVTPGLMAQAFSQVKREPRVKGVVLRLSSPGGGALAADDIHHLATKAATKKPTVVSMANVAASGAYYISTAGRELFANPATITGSIGLYAGKPNLTGLYEKIDLHKELYLRGRHAGLYLTSRGFTDGEREKAYSQINALYRHFVDLVAENRGMSVDSVDQLARGRVWTGREALDNGLVDYLGGIKQALDFTAGQAGVKEYTVEVYPKRRPLFVLPAFSLLGAVSSVFGGTEDPATGNPLEDLRMEPGGLYARLPYDLVIE